MELTHTQVRAAKPGAKIKRLSDGGGLVLTVKTTGSKIWHLRYRYGCKASMVSLGPYPEVSLAEAREKAAELRAAARKGADIGAVLREERMGEEERMAEEEAAKAKAAANTFATVAEAWVRQNELRWVAGHTKRIRNRIELDVNPTIGTVPVSEITAPMVLATLQGIENRGAIDTAKRVKGIVGSVMGYATAIGLAQGDPTALLSKAMKASPPTQHRAAIIDPVRLSEFLNDLEDWPGETFGRPLLQLILLTFQRPGEVRNMRWSEIDWERAVWEFHVSKVAVDHVVPLSRQALALLREVEEVTGGREFVFQSRGGKPVSDVIATQFLTKLGWKGRATAHGFRATARTMLAERLRFDPRVIELQLSHAVPEVHAKAYNRAVYIDDRIRMMQEWADYLDRLRDGGEVVNLPGRAGQIGT
jgi:integrase